MVLPVLALLGFAHAYDLSDKAASLCSEAEGCAKEARSAVCSLHSMLNLVTNSMQEAYRPCMTLAPRQPTRAPQRVFRCNFSCASRRMRQCRPRTCCCRGQHGNTREELQGVKQKLWPSLGVLSPLIVNPTASRADEVTTAAGDVAQAAAKATADLPPTVTFGGSFGQYDPIIAFFFYAVIATLTVLTLGVGHYISLTRLPCQRQFWIWPNLPEGLRSKVRSYAGLQL